jgi:acyl-CoA thioesterase FadM
MYDLTRGGTTISRVKLQEQPEYKFKYIRKIRKSDLNYAGHLGNDNLISIIQEARIAVFNELGYTELDLGDGKTGIIIGDLVVNFMAEGFEADELLIESQFGEQQENSIRLFYRVSRVTDGTLLALVETGLVAFDYKTHKTSKWPEKFLKYIL